MDQDEYGFFVPIVSDPQKCIACDQCHEVCPVINNELENVDYGIATYAAYSKNDSLREDSSSGGLFSELATNIIHKGGIVYGAAYDDQWNVKHIAISAELDLRRIRIAKYSQSDLGNTFTEIQTQLNHDKSALFVGCPCQVAGLKAFLKRPYENLICIDFVCHGIPSPGVWKEYVKYRASQDNSGHLPIAINLRSKESGWSKYQYSIHFQYDDEHEYNCLGGLDPFMKLFTEDFINRECCSDCKFKGEHRWSDITLGDFWGIWDIDPSMDDNKGTSMVIIHTSAGKDLFDSIVDNLVMQEVSLAECSLQNPSLIDSAKPNSNRDKVLKQIVVNGFISENTLFSNKQTITTVLKKIKRKIIR